MFSSPAFSTLSFLPCFAVLCLVTKETDDKEPDSLDRNAAMAVLLAVAA